MLGLLSLAVTAGASLSEWMNSIDAWRRRENAVVFTPEPDRFDVTLGLRDMCGLQRFRPRAIP
jgi:hypothetical protein